RGPPRASFGASGLTGFREDFPREGQKPPETTLAHLVQGVCMGQSSLIHAKPREPTRLETLVQRLRESLVPARRQREEETTPPPPPRGRAPPPPPRGRAPPARGGAPTPPPDSARRRRYSSSVLAFSPVGPDLAEDG
uniref:Uncharacterized protein n=1 Tax=Aegilops tauschii subsp. strangulata TaxID=200361 RepID=A0A453PPT0_AEGTS